MTIKYYLYRDFLESTDSSIIQAIIVCLIFSFLFKIGAFPLHWWVPDIYESSWLFSTAFFMIITKLVFFCFFSRILLYFFAPFISVWQPILILSSFGSVIIGSLGSIMQTKLKRVFAYTSITQMGFALLGLSSGTISGIASSFFFYLYIYLQYLFYL